MNNFRTLLVILVVALSFATPALAACFTYSKPVVIVGELERITFPGPPNFENISAGDEPQTGFYLKLAKPICVVGSLGSSVNEPVKDVSEIQLILAQRGYKLFQPAIGKIIRVRGSLMSAFNANHHAPLLLQHPVVVTLSGNRR
jgi:hypothetical protein